MANSPAAALSYPIATGYGDAPAVPRGPLALPGLYRVRLIVDGVTTEQPLRLRMDPTVHIIQARLEAEHTLAVALNASLTRASVVAQALASIRSQVRQRSAAQESAAVALAYLDSLAERLERGDASLIGITRLASDVQKLYEQIDGADAMPTDAQNAASKARLARLLSLEGGVTELRKVINRVTNPALRESRIPEIGMSAGTDQLD